MMRCLTWTAIAAASVAILGTTMPIQASASRWQVRQAVREQYRDRYYRGNDRWHRDGRYWDRYEYERRYDRRRDNDSDVLKGPLVRAAVMGVAAAIVNPND